MSLKSTFVDLLAKKIVGGVHFETAKSVVQQAERTDLKGRAKFDYAMARFMQIARDAAYELPLYLINFALEAAVVWLNSRK